MTHASDQLFNFLVQGTVIGRIEQGHTGPGGGGRAYVKFRIIHRTGFRKNGKWVATQPMEFVVTCWDEQQMLLARRALKPGTEVLVTVKKLVPLTGDNDEAIMNITPANILPLPGNDSGSAPARGQRSGDLVSTPYGEKVDADAWPDVVTDLEFVHHG
jgi:hypothetical protein